MSGIRFGPAGLGSVKEAENNLESYHKLGLEACEIAFTYGIYIKSKEDALRIGSCAKEFGISLSIHAPYWINLNSEEKEKVEKSKERILECCRVGTQLGAKRIVFHAGFYGRVDREESYQNIKNRVIEIMKETEERGYSPLLAPETTGKINVFGSVNDILRLVKDTGCSFCIDFAHVLAREKRIDYKTIFEKLENFKEIHVHFSGIEYGEKGEKKHKATEKDKVKELLKNIPNEKQVVIINESPIPVEDSVMSLEEYRKL